MTISEKVAYLKGLADGLDLDKEPSKEGKIIAKIIDVLEDVGFAPWRTWRSRWKP